MSRNIKDYNVGQWQKDKITQEDFAIFIEQVKSYISKRMNHYSIHPNDREDMCQEVLLKLFLVLNYFDFKKSTPIEHYINRIIKHVKCDYVRAKFNRIKRQDALIQTYTTKHQMALLDSCLETNLLVNEKIDCVYSMLTKFTDLERTIMQYILQDYKPKEIARILKIEVKVVYNAIQRCKMKLKQSIKDND